MKKGSRAKKVVESLITSIPEIKRKPEPEPQPEPIPDAKDLNTCACEHGIEMHYGSADNWCNTRGCLCQAFKSK